MSVIGKAYRNIKKSPGLPVPLIQRVPPRGISAAQNTLRYLEGYGEIGWLYAVVSKIAQSVGKTQWVLKQRRGDEAIPLGAENPVRGLLSDANPHWTGQELLEYTQLFLDLAGEAFWVLNFDAQGRPDEIWPIPPNRIRIVPSKTNYIDGYWYDFGNIRIPLEPERVIFFRYPDPANLYRGLGPVQAASLDLDIELFSAQWVRNFFLNSARPDAVLELEETLGDTEYVRLQQQWRQRHQGVDRAHRVAILEGGVRYKQISLSPQQMQAVVQRQFNRDQIMGMYSVPKIIMGITDDVNRASAEAAALVYAEWAILPRLERIAAKLNETLIPMFGDNLFLDFVSPVTGDLDAETQEAGRAVKDGYWTVNEARIHTGQKPLANGDVLLLNAQTIPLPVGNGVQQRALTVTPTHRGELVGPVKAEDEILLVRPRNSRDRPLAVPANITAAEMEVAFEAAANRYWNLKMPDEIGLLEAVVATRGEV